MSIPTLTGNMLIQLEWINAQLPVAGLSPRTSSEKIAGKQSYAQGAGAGAVNEVYFAVLTIAGAGNTTLDLSTGLVDVLGQALGFARVKALMVWLLAAADVLADGTAGTACSGITVGNAATNPFGGAGYPLGDAAAATMTFVNGEKFGRCRGDAAGWVVDATHKSLKVVNNDAGVAAKVVVAVLGADV